MVGPLARVFVFSCLNVFCYVGLAAHSASFLPLSSKKALEDPTALFGPPLETAFEAQKTEGTSFNKLKTKTACRNLTSVELEEPLILL